MMALDNNRTGLTRLMRTGNPGLNDKTFAALPHPALAEERMTLRGTINKSFLMLVVLLAAALWTWSQYLTTGNPAAVAAPMIVGAIAGLVLALIISFKPTTAPYLALPYAACEGLLMGGISAEFERRYPGIAIQAVALTFGVLAAMLLAYKTGLIKVTQRFMAIVVAGTGAIMLLYLVSMGLNLFHVATPFLYDSSPLSIGISLVIIAFAALNLVLDFAMIESGVSQGAPRYMEWYSAFGLLVTLVWLYLEILRFLAKAQRR
jgi:uncharacterized YccA/Bax inhibitor family protein